MKRVMIFLLLTVLLCGCASAPAAPAQTAAPAEAPQAAEEASETARSVYYDCLMGFCNNGELPDGRKLELSEGDFGAMGENRFAVADFDGDGEEELAIEFTTAATSDSCFWLYGYDAESGSVYEELCVFPNVTFYTNGFIGAGWSHNQGLAGDALWPYTLMQYVPEKHSYVELAQVDAWDKSFRETNFKGEHFPDEIDVEDSGVVYLITEISDGKYSDTDTINWFEYEGWLVDKMGDVSLMHPEFSALTSENIAKLIA